MHAGEFLHHSSGLLLSNSLQNKLSQHFWLQVSYLRISCFLLQRENGIGNLMMKNEQLNTAPPRYSLFGNIYGSTLQLLAEFWGYCRGNFVPDEKEKNSLGSVVGGKGEIPANTICWVYQKFINLSKLCKH